MTKQEFEQLALRNNESIGMEMFASVNYFYMSENDYHKKNGGIEESKQAFVKRVYGGKVNTPKTICEKTANESDKENRFALRGNASAESLNSMTKIIKEHYNTMLKYCM